MCNFIDKVAQTLPPLKLKAKNNGCVPKTIHKHVNRHLVDKISENILVPAKFIICIDGNSCNSTCHNNIYACMLKKNQGSL